MLSFNQKLKFKEIDELVKLVTDKQLKITRYWKHFTDSYKTHDDDVDNGWRGEFFGKMMRGSALIYQYSKDKELYAVLEQATKDLLSAQDEFGRFSTYSIDKEFNGWDIWSRKYVITGLLHFYDICKDRALKKQIIIALTKHVDYIIEHVGPKKGQIDICKTSEWWGGVNSSSILETIMNFYSRTKKQKYLRFAKYLVERGGTIDENIVKLAIEDIKAPYQYKYTKAYETMSYMEGVFEYAKEVKDEQLMQAVYNFAEKVNETDITVIGSAGCTHELFDNSSKMQTVESEIIMQETCVTVTWIRLCTKLLMYTENVKYFEYIESSFYNGLLGAINTNMDPLYNAWDKVLLEPMLFDSYSVLCNGKRCKGTGGQRDYTDGTYFGCCIAIAAAGIALMPLTAVMKDDDGTLIFNNYYTGKVGSIQIKSNYVKQGKVKLIFTKDGHYKLKLRVPEWSMVSTMTMLDKTFEVSNGYLTIEEDFVKGNTIELEFDNSIDTLEINDSVCFIKHPIVLAFDEQKQTGVDVHDVKFNLEKLHVKKVKPQDDEQLRFSINGYILSDYSTCGKHYHVEHNMMSCWFKK